MSNEQPNKSGALFMKVSLVDDEPLAYSIGGILSSTEIRCIEED